MKKRLIIIATSLSLGTMLYANSADATMTDLKVSLHYLIKNYNEVSKNINTLMLTDEELNSVSMRNRAELNSSIANNGEKIVYNNEKIAFNKKSITLNKKAINQNGAALTEYGTRVLNLDHNLTLMQCDIKELSHKIKELVKKNNERFLLIEKQIERTGVTKIVMKSNTHGLHKTMMELTDDDRKIIRFINEQ